MTTIKTVAAYEVVQRTFPRVVTEPDELGRAVGKSIDSALSQYSYESSRGRRPTASSMQAWAASVLDEELRDVDLPVDVATRERILAGVSSVLQAFRRSEVFGMSRPRSRLILIDNEVGIYAQPDYWDARNRVYEMKSYLAVPPPPDVALQLQLFQLAFPGFEMFLFCINRHTLPAVATVTPIPTLDMATSRRVLTLAREVARELGQPKVLEYVENTPIRYALD